MQARTDTDLTGGLGFHLVFAPTNVLRRCHLAFVVGIVFICALALNTAHSLSSETPHATRRTTTLGKGEKKRGEEKITPYN